MASAHSILDFYYSFDKSLHGVEEVQDEYDRMNGNIHRFKGYMFCPECKKAALTFTHRTSKRRCFLSVLPSSNHDMECSYVYEPAKKSALTRYIKSVKNDSELRDRLEAVLNRLYDGVSHSLKNNKDETKPTNSFVLDCEDDKETTRASIPSRSLLRINNQDNGFAGILYGEVYLRVEPASKEIVGFFNLIIMVENASGERKYRAKVFLGKDNPTVDETQKYQIAILGCLDCSRKYPQIRIEKNSAIYYRIGTS